MRDTVRNELNPEQKEEDKINIVFYPCFRVGIEKMKTTPGINRPGSRREPNLGVEGGGGTHHKSNLERPGFDSLIYCVSVKGEKLVFYYTSLVASKIEQILEGNAQEFGKVAPG